MIVSLMAFALADVSALSLPFCVGTHGSTSANRSTTATQRQRSGG